MSWNNVMPAWVVVLENVERAVETAHSDGHPLSIEHVDALLESHGVPTPVVHNNINKWRKDGLLQ